MTVKQLLGFFLIVLLDFSLYSFADSDQVPDYYSPDNVRRFADFLFKKGDYLRAAGEYQRCIFFEPDDSEEIHYKVALCYRLGGKPEEAIRAFQTFLHAHPDSWLSNGAYYQIGVSYFLLEQFPQSISYLDAALPRITDEPHHAESQELIGLSYLMQRRWLEADEVFNGLGELEVAEIRTRAKLYHDFAMQGTQLPKRSPYLAGFFSTLIPGTGRLYTGRIGDAVTSLLTVGITGFQAYHGFRRDGTSSAKGWVFGALGESSMRVISTAL